MEDGESNHFHLDHQIFERDTFGFKPSCTITYENKTDKWIAEYCGGFRIMVKFEKKVNSEDDTKTSQEDEAIESKDNSGNELPF